MKKYIYSLLFCLLFSAHVAHGASLSLSPSSSNVSAGNIITLNVLVDTQGKVINTSDAVIQFPSDLLDVVSLNSKSSIFTLWVEDPAFSNTTGQITFNGGIPNPGYQGSNGTILSITFRAKKAGTASIIFGDSSVRENDGFGTDILSSKNTAKLTIADNTPAPTTQTVTPTPQPVTTQSSTPATITSSSHPNQDAWYSNNTVALSWSVPSGTQTIQTLLGSHANSVPTVSYTPPILKKDVKNLDDGIVYFHLRYMTDAGWSPVSHYRIQIDTTRPKNLQVTSAKDDSGVVTLNMSADDSLSGVDHYTIQVDGGAVSTMSADNSGKAVYTLPTVSAGDHTYLVKAYDKAGNAVETTGSVNVNSTPSISITSYPASVKTGEEITAVGHTPAPNDRVQISLMTDDARVENYKIQADSNGIFHFTSEPINTQGTYTLWANLVNTNGDVVTSSQKVTVSVEKPIIIQIGSYATSLLSVVIPIVALLVLFVFSLYYAYRKFFALRSHMRKDLQQLQNKIHQTFKSLADDISEQITSLENTSKKRKLTAREEKTMASLKEHLSEIESSIQKMLEKVKDANLK